jgi:hypothetical protein
MQVYRAGSPGQILGARGGRDNLDGAAVAAGNRAIFSAHRILASPVAEFFNLFNRANVSQINPVFGSGLIPIPGFRQPIAGTGARQIQFSLDFEF